MQVTNLTLWSNFSGVWRANATNSSPLNNTNTNFTVGGLVPNLYAWNCLASDNTGQTAFAAANNTIVINASCGTITQNMTMYNNVTTPGSCFSVQLNNVTLDGNGFAIIGDGGASDAAVLANNGWYANTTIKNIYIYNIGRGVYFMGAVSMTISSSTFTTITNAVAVTYNGNSNLILSNNKIYNSTALVNVWTGLPPKNDDNWIISNNSFYNQSGTQTVIYYWKSGSGDTNNWTIANNTFTYVNGIVLELYPNDSIVADNVIQNASPPSNAGVFQIYAGNFTIRNNTFNNITGTNAGTHVIFVNASWGYKIGNGSIDNNSITGTGTTLRNGIALIAANPLGALGQEPSRLQSAD